MYARFMLIAAATLASGNAFAAQPVKPAPQPQSSQPQPAPPQVVLASADEVRAPSASDQQAPATPKRRIGRVTTCRCGDPETQPEQ